MINNELKNTDPEDIEDLLLGIEYSFGIQFTNNELADIKTFGQLCDHIADKIQLEQVNDCTTQQAFYKLRDAISTVLQTDKKTINTNLPLTTLFTRHNRRTMILKLENHLGFKLNLLRPPHWISTTLLILFFASLIGFFFNWRIALIGLVGSTIGLWLAGKLGTVFKLQTVGQAAEEMMRNNYLKSRRDPSTFNKKEIENVLIDLFSNNLGIEKSKLTRDAPFT